MKTILLSSLTKHDACIDQVELFKKTFGKRCDITLANFDKACRVGLNVGWFMHATEGKIIPRDTVNDISEKAVKVCIASDNFALGYCICDRESNKRYRKYLKDHGVC